MFQVFAKVKRPSLLLRSFSKVRVKRKCILPLVKYNNICKIRPFSTSVSSIDNLYNGVISSDRRDLARAITLVESKNPQDNENAKNLLRKIINYSNENGKKTYRIGITGPPGAGKSSFINLLGTKLCDMGHRVAALPIDPSSYISGGSILGDATRMPDLSNHANSYVRPSPNKLSLGGISDTTSEVILLCEAANYNIIFIESVGVGQSEIEINNICDMFVLLLTPSSGDDLQGIKRGIIEMSDLIIINKADNDLIKLARHIKSDYTRALSLINNKRKYWKPKIILNSCHDNNLYNVLDIWNVIDEYFNLQNKYNELELNRKYQRKHIMWQYVWRKIKQNIENIKDNLEPIESQAVNGQLSPRESSELIVNQFWKY